MRRYTITLHASTSTGGKVTTASANGSIAGKRIAVEGDCVSCPACKTEGKILCVPPRNREHWGGKQVALENDFCLCKCPVLPQLISDQNIRYQQFSSATASTPAEASDNASDDCSRFENIVEQYFSLVDANGDPVNEFRYDLLVDGELHTKAGQFISGKTIKIESKKELDLIAWLAPRKEN